MDESFLESEKMSLAQRIADFDRQRDEFVARINVLKKVTAFARSSQGN